MLVRISRGFHDAPTASSLVYDEAWEQMHRHPSISREPNNQVGQSLCQEQVAWEDIHKSTQTLGLHTGASLGTEEEAPEEPPSGSEVTQPSS